MTVTRLQTPKPVKLDPIELDALVLLALLFSPQTPEKWAMWMNECGLEATPDSVTALAKRLAKRGLIVARPGPQLSFALCEHGPGMLLPIAHENDRLLPLWERVEGVVEKARTSHVMMARIRYFDQTVRIALLVGKLRVSLAIGHTESVDVTLYELQRWCDMTGHFAGRVEDALGADPPNSWVEQLPDDVLAGYLGEVINTSQRLLTPVPAAAPTWIGHSGKRRLTMALARVMALQGNADIATKLGKFKKSEPEIIELLGHFSAGDYRAAADLGDSLVAALKQRKYKQLGEIEGPIHALVRIVTMQGDPGRVAAVRQSLEEAVNSRCAYPELYIALAEFERITRSGRVPASPPIEFSVAGAHGMWWFELLVNCLCMHWLGLDLRQYAVSAVPYIQTWHERAVHNGFPGVARELGALLAIFDQQPPPTPSLAAAYERREPWQMILETIESSVKSIEADQTAAASDAGFREHVIWEVQVGKHSVDINARLLKSPRSRKGQVVALSTLLGTKIDCLTDADRKVLATVQDHGGARWRGYPGGLSFGSGWETLLALIDHPRVRQADGEPLRITRGQATVRSRTEAGATILELDPPELARKPIAHKVITSGHIEVFDQDPKLAPVYALFARADALKIPSSGRERLLDSLAGLATTTELRVEGESSLSSREVEPDSTLILQLQWDGSTFVAVAKVAPLGPTGPHFVPGEGPVKLVARVDQAMLACARDLAEEQRRFDAMLDACPGLASQPLDDDRWRILELDTALEVLLELHALGETVTLTWPLGRKLNVPRELTSKHLRVAVSSKQNWMQVDVELDADEGRVLGFKQLLEGRRGSGRFVALGDDRFLALTSDLRKRIDSLENLGTIKKAKLEVHGVTLPLIEQIVADPTAFRADKKAQKRLTDLQTIAAKTPRIPRGFQADLRDYQIEGFRWMARLADAGLGAVLADDMGLGKTIQALALLCQRSKRGPALVVAPTSVVSNWRSEAERFAPRLRCHTLATSDDRAGLFASVRAGDVILCSYGLLVSEAKALAELQFSTVIFDEAHALKNSRSQRAKAAFALTSEFRLALTGTPIENHLGELWSVFQATVPGLLASEKRFDERFSRPISQGQRERARQLRAMVRPFMLRRTKAQVLDELPPRTEVTIRITPTPAEKAFYEALRRDALEQTAGLEGKGGKSRLRILAEITRLRQAAVDPRLIDAEHGPPGAKIEALIRRLVDLRDEGHRALVFTQFLGSMTTIHERLDQQGIRYLGFDGSTPAKQRTKVVDAFQAGEADVFVMSLKAGGVGINLTEADYVFHLDPWWNPAVEDQATGRAHRIGQQRPVTVYRLVTAGTIEEQILELHGTKRDLADDLLAGLDSAKKLDLNELRALLQGA